MGLVVESEKAVSRQILKLRETIALVIGMLQAVIIIIAVIAISLATMIATMFNRIEYYRILRVLGASRTLPDSDHRDKVRPPRACRRLGRAALLLAVCHGAGCGVFQPHRHHGAGGRARRYISQILFYGTLVPVLSAVPALVRLYFKGLSGDLAPAMCHGDLFLRQ